MKNCNNKELMNLTYQESSAINQNMNLPNFAICSAYKKSLIWCTSWYNAGSRMIENKFRGCFFLFLAPAAGSNSMGHYHIPFPNLVGQN